MIINDIIILSGKGDDAMNLVWSNLLLAKRHRDKVTVERRENDNRSQFKRDFDTVCNSTILRRLQDKAQVFPLESEDYARTRLTHSIEVMSIAESIGMYAVRVINNHEQKYISSSKKIKETKMLINDIPTILKTVALLHDMGNPPFGHLGEQIIGDWFKSNLKRLSFNSDRILSYKSTGDVNDNLEHILTGDFAEDLKNFDGNAQLFRLVNKLSLVVDENGMNLTYPVMASFIKYPTASSEINKNILSKKKVGYFTAEKSIYQDINQELKLGGARHPLAYLLEAADDIAYLTADIEDAHHKGIITRSTIEKAFENKKDDEFINTILESMKEYQNKAEEMGYDDVDNYVMHRTRVLIKGLMIDAVCYAFDNSYVQIMKGDFNNELLKCSKANKMSKILREIEKEKIYYSSQILTNKTRAFSVLQCLLDTYVPAIINWNPRNDEGKDTSNNLIYQSFSKNYKYICDLANNKTDDEKRKIYNKLLLVTDQISGMTDRHAMTAYRMIKPK